MHIIVGKMYIINNKIVAKDLQGGNRIRIMKMRAQLNTRKQIDNTGRLKHFSKHWYC